jgi:uncharacterized protein (DUF1800 family)
MTKTDIALIAHLYRRAGFGATRDELEACASRSYEDIVEELLHPERLPDVDDYLLRRYFMELNNSDTVNAWRGNWIYRMVNTQRPLQEKMTLFWHHVFATSVGKSEHGPSSVEQIGMFRQNGLGDFRTILIELARDPAMIFWLDNCENHNGEPNENWGRELLELFSMGVGNYTEQDIKNASRAFTGWTFNQPIPLDPYGRYPSQFIYRQDDHDDSEKTFLGHTGRFNGEDIIDIIVQQPAAARFVARHLYNFFVADEPQVPAWNIVPPQDPQAIQTLMDAYFQSNGNMRSVLRTLFNSDFFKNARFKKVKSPAELVAGTVKLTGTFRAVEPGLAALGEATSVMGQNLMTPPTVEGWHTGREWIDGGTLNARVNFAVDQLADSSKPGVQAIISKLNYSKEALSPEEFVDVCLELSGPLDVAPETREGLLEYASSGGELRFDSDEQRKESPARVTRMLQLIVSSLDYQFA